LIIGYLNAQRHGIVVLRYEDPDSVIMRFIGINGYDYAKYYRCEVCIKDSIFLERLINRFQNLPKDTNFYVGDVTYQLICIKPNYGYDIFNSSSGYCTYPWMELNGKPMIVDKKILRLLDEIVKIHKRIKKPQFLPDEKIKELLNDTQYW
jgi:hypothetical protein